MSSRHALIEFVILAGLLAAPVIGHLLGLNESPQHENRRLAALPGLPADESQFRAFSGRLDDYLNDHFGFRRALIEKVDMARFYILGESTSPQVTIGAGGRLFLNSHDAKTPDDLFAYTCSRQNAAADAAAITRHISRIAKAYAARGIAVSFVVVPNAVRIYADQLSGAISPALIRDCLSAAPDRYALASQALARQGIVFLYPLAEFRRWRTAYDVYPRRYYHWAGETPWRTAGLLFARLGLSLPDGVPRRTKAQTSDLRGLMGGFHLNSAVYGPDPEKLGSRICLGPPCIDSQLFALTRKGYQVTVTRSDDAPGGRAVLVSDSFGGAITAGLARGYKELIHLYPVSPPEGDATAFYNTVIPRLEPERVVFVYNDNRIDGVFQMIADALDGVRATQAPAGRSPN